MEEIEKKYLIMEGENVYDSETLSGLYSTIEKLKEDVIKNGKTIKQGYLPLDQGLMLSKTLGMDIDFEPTEARLRNKNGKLFFTLKGKGGLSRNEAEVNLAQELFDDYWTKTKGRRVEKVRLDKKLQGYTAEIDVYTDRDLIVAEIEVPTVAEAERLKPLGKDVTEDKSYKNKNLAK